MPEHSPEVLKEALLIVMPENGEAITLKRARGWLCRYLGQDVTHDQFEALKIALIGEGWLSTGAGQGGTISLALNPPTVSASVPDERSLYPITKRFIETKLIADLKLDNCRNLVEITADQGRTRGRFLHPDLAMLSCAEHRYLGTRATSIYTFEVKTAQGGNATAVLEALSQRKRSHFGYVVWHLETPEDAPHHLEQVEEYARQYGIGLILLQQITQTGHDALEVVDYDVKVYAERTSSEPVYLEEVVENHFSEVAKETVLSWYARPESGSE